MELFTEGGKRLFGSGELSVELVVFLGLSLGSRDIDIKLLF